METLDTWVGSGGEVESSGTADDDRILRGGVLPPGGNVVDRLTPGGTMLVIVVVIVDPYMTLVTVEVVRGDDVPSVGGLS